MSSPTLRQLEIFAQMVASGNITDCADTLGVSPASVKAELRALERRLGYQLCSFDDELLILTPAGHKAAEAMTLLSATEPDCWQDVAVPAAELSAPNKAEQPVPDVAAHKNRIEHRPEQSRSEQEQKDSKAPVNQLKEEPASAPVQDFRPAPPPEPGPKRPGPALVSPVGDLATDHLLKAEGRAIETIAWTAISETEVSQPPQRKDHKALNEEPLELTEVALDPITTQLEPASSSDLSVEPVDQLGSETVADPSSDAESEVDNAKVVQLPHALAVRVAFASQAPASFPRPTVVSLFAESPLPLPVNDAAPMTAPVHTPVIEPQIAPQKVVVAAHPSVFSHFQEALAAFEQANPDVSITLELDAFTAMRAEPLLASGKVDILYYYAMGERERFVSRYVWSESLSIFIGADHPLARLDAVNLEDLVGVRPLLLGSRNGLRPILDHAMLRAGIDLWQPAMETDNLFNIMTAVREGTGFFVAFGPTARDFGKMDGIKRMPFADPLPPIEVRQAVREAVRNDPIVSSLAEYLFR